MSQNLPDIAHALLDAARTAGAEAADAMVVQDTSVHIDVRAGALEQAERSEGIDIGLRVLIGQRQANVSASDVTPATLNTMAERAVAMAREAPQDPYVGLAEPGQLVQNWDIDALELYDASAEPDPQTLQADALAAETAAAAVEGVTQVQSSSAAYGTASVHLAASNGFSGGYRRSSRSISCVAISGSGTGMERDYDGDMRLFQSDLRLPEEIGRSAGERAAARQGARKPKTGTYSVIFDERISSSLVGHLLAAVNGAAVARGASWLRDAMGEQVLPQELSITEDPHRPRVTGTRPFDAEGLPTAKRHLREHGNIQGGPLDLATARKRG